MRYDPYSATSSTIVASSETDVSEERDDCFNALYI